MHAEVRRVILNLLEENSSAQVLDCGCADGGFTQELARKIGTSEICGFDLVDEFVQAAEAKGIKVYLGDLNNPLPLDSDTFDVVHANQVIEHLHETDTFVKEIYRILKRGGYAIIATDNLAGLHNMLSLVLGFQPFSACPSNEVHIGNPIDFYYRMETNRKYPAHLRIFTYRGLKELFEYHGFKVEKLIGVGYYPFPRTIAKLLSSVDPRHAVCLVIKVRKAM